MKKLFLINIMFLLVLNLNAQNQEPLFHSALENIINENPDIEKKLKDYFNIGDDMVLAINEINLTIESYSINHSDDSYDNTGQTFDLILEELKLQKLSSHINKFSKFDETTKEAQDYGKKIVKTIEVNATIKMSIVAYEGWSTRGSQYRLDIKFKKKGVKDTVFTTILEGKKKYNKEYNDARTFIILRGLKNNTVQSSLEYRIGKDDKKQLNEYLDFCYVNLQTCYKENKPAKEKLYWVSEIINLNKYIYKQNTPTLEKVRDCLISIIAKEK